ncbi:MAG: hypothetical protein Ct9H300mP19_14860 [Dehalococcoidia bacterium]|nr:MAG: hypothetical protein Ct9H300mP19_14860 [Dehalococcoidia bacterium]
MTGHLTIFLLDLLIRKELHTSLPAVEPGVTAAAHDPKLADSPTTWVLSLIESEGTK